MRSTVSKQLLSTLKPDKARPGRAGPNQFLVSTNFTTADHLPEEDVDQNDDVEYEVDDGKRPIFKQTKTFSSIIIIIIIK